MLIGLMSCALPAAESRRRNLGKRGSGLKANQKEALVQSRGTSDEAVKSGCRLLIPESVLPRRIIG